MELVYERVAGMDISKADAVVCVRIAGCQGKADRQTTTWGARTSQILELAQYLKQCEVTRVVMEATSSYWKPFYFRLEEAGLTVVLANPRQVRQIPGRKTDVADAVWLADLAAHDLVKGSFVQDQPTRELKDLVRRRTKLTRLRGQEVQRIEKTLESAGVKLSGPGGKGLTDLMGVSGRAMLEVMCQADYDPTVVAGLADPRVKARHAELTEALTGRFTGHHRVLVRSCLNSVDHFTSQIAELDQRVQGYFSTTEQLSFEGMSADQVWRVDMAAKRELLKSIPGVDKVVAEMILSEIGPDVSCFPTAGNLASWAGVVPGHNQSAGKSKAAKTREGNKQLKGALGIAGKAAIKKKTVFLGAFYKRVLVRRGHQRALVAVSRKIIEAVWWILTTGEPYPELGAAYYDQRKPRTTIRASINRLSQVGCVIQHNLDGTITIGIPLEKPTSVMGHQAVVRSTFD
jgi:transposase